MTHAVVPVAMGLGLGRRFISAQLLVAGAVLAMAPDLDVIAFKMGIPYAHVWGHRGASHSLMMAAVAATIASFVHPRLNCTAQSAFWFIFFAVASHGILDIFTDGGLGIALAWPFSEDRYFAPVRFIAVSPIGLQSFLTPRGLYVLYSEFLTVWIPTIVIALGLGIVQRRFRPLRD